MDVFSPYTRKKLSKLEEEKKKAKAAAEAAGVVFEAPDTGGSSGSTGTAVDHAAVSKNILKFQHKIIEVCTREDSCLGSARYVDRGAEVFRVTMKMDFSTVKGLHEAIHYAEENPGCDLWGSSATKKSLI